MYTFLEVTIHMCYRSENKLSSGASGFDSAARPLERSPPDPCCGAVKVLPFPMVGEQKCRRKLGPNHVRTLLAMIKSLVVANMDITARWKCSRLMKILVSSGTLSTFDILVS